MYGKGKRSFLIEIVCNFAQHGFSESVVLGSVHDQRGEIALHFAAHSEINGEKKIRFLLKKGLCVSTQDEVSCNKL